VCLCVGVSRAWPSAWTWHRACSPARRRRCVLRRRRPMLPHTTVVLTRNSLHEIAKIASVTTYSAVHWPKAAERSEATAAALPLAKARTARSSAKRSAGSHWPKSSRFSAASHILPKRPAAELRRARATARCCAPQSSPRVQTTVAPSSLPDLTIISNTGPRCGA
jgi:hypothetical protein